MVAAKKAMYVNWHSPFLWSQIAAGQRVGWQMSASEIHNELQ